MPPPIQEITKGGASKAVADGFYIITEPLAKGTYNIHFKSSLHVTSNAALYAMKTLAQNVQGIQVFNSGHWIPEERPDIIIKLLDNFFGSNTTSTGTSKSAQIPLL